MTRPGRRISSVTPAGACSMPACAATASTRSCCAPSGLVPRVKPRTLVLAFIKSDIGRTALLAREFRFKPYFVPVGQGEGQGLFATSRCRPDGPPRRSTVCAPSWAIRICSMTSCAAWGKVRLWYGDSIGTGLDADLISCRLMARFAELVRREGVKALVVAFLQADGWANPSLGAAQRRRTGAVLDCAAKAGNSRPSTPTTGS